MKHERNRPVFMASVVNRRRFSKVSALSAFDLIVLTALLPLSLVSCNKKEIRNEVDFEFVSGVLIIKGTVNAKIEGMFQLDTGADISIITKEYFDKLDLSSKEKITATIAGGRVMEVPTVEVSSIALGDNRTSISSVAVIDMSKQKVPDNTAGILGSDYLRNLIITIRYGDKKLIFEDENSLSSLLNSGIKIPIKFSDSSSNVPYLNVTINDSVSNSYLFDTGVPLTHLTYTDFQAIGLSKDMKKVKRITNHILGSTFEEYVTNISSFALHDSLRIENIEIASYEDCPGLIGNNFISNYIVTLNYKGKYILFNKYE